METDSESALNSLEKGNVVLAASEGLKTVGALDLGGSSLEVTFIPGKTNSETVNGEQGTGFKICLDACTCCISHFRAI